MTEALPSGRLGQVLKAGEQDQIEPEINTVGPLSNRTGECLSQRHRIAESDAARRPRNWPDGLLDVTRLLEVLKVLSAGESFLIDTTDFFCVTCDGKFGSPKGGRGAPSSPAGRPTCIDQ